MRCSIAAMRWSSPPWSPRPARPRPRRARSRWRWASGRGAGSSAVALAARRPGVGAAPTVEIAAARRDIRSPSRRAGTRRATANSTRLDRRPRGAGRWRILDHQVPFRDPVPCCGDLIRRHSGTSRAAKASKRGIGRLRRATCDRLPAAPRRRGDARRRARRARPARGRCRSRSHSAAKCRAAAAEWSSDHAPSRSSVGGGRVKGSGIGCVDDALGRSRRPAGRPASTCSAPASRSRRSGPAERVEHRLQPARADCRDLEPRRARRLGGALADRVDGHAAKRASAVPPWRRALALPSSRRRTRPGRARCQATGAISNSGAPIARRGPCARAARPSSRSPARAG